ncbi:MAG: hypothetical protein JW384_02033 [Nitrosomonadaceae bacterium]|nr:hypothetical protein [Nitrosomonadaceae bacterium]
MKIKSTTPLDTLQLARSIIKEQLDQLDAAIIEKAGKKIKIELTFTTTNSKFLIQILDQIEHMVEKDEVPYLKRTIHEQSNLSIESMWSDINPDQVRRICAEKNK